MSTSSSLCRLSRPKVVVDATSLQKLFGGSSCPVLCGGPEVAVGVQRRGRRGVPESPLDGDDVAAGGDQAGGVEVPEVVQLHPGETR